MMLEGSAAGSSSPAVGAGPWRKRSQRDARRAASACACSGDAASAPSPSPAAGAGNGPCASAASANELASSRIVRNGSSGSGSTIVFGPNAAIGSAQSLPAITT